MGTCVFGLAAIALLAAASRKDEIADIVKSELAQVMDGFGYGVLKALVTDIEPDGRVKESMNENGQSARWKRPLAARSENHVARSRAWKRKLSVMSSWSRASSPPEARALRFKWYLESDQPRRAKLPQVATR
jgi:regulator of protease activity HflC (stomatin/prohibitin superfamily)